MDKKLKFTFLKIGTFRSHWLTDRQTDRQRNWATGELTDQLADWLTDWQTDRLPDRQTNRRTDWQTDWLTDWPTHWMTAGLTDWQTDRLTDGPTDRLTDGRTDWLRYDKKECNGIRLTNIQVLLIRLYSETRSTAIDASLRSTVLKIGVIKTLQKAVLFCFYNSLMRAPKFPKEKKLSNPNITNL